MEWNLQKNYEFCLNQYDEEGETAKGSDYLEESSRNECERMKERRQVQTAIKKKMWVLVFDVEENKHRPPILLEEVQDKSGRNGVKANLKKHDKVLYDAGGKLQKAFIVGQSDNKEELDKKYEKMVALMKQAQEERSGNLWHYTKVIGGGLVAGGLAVAAAPLALSAAGFTAGGIAAGSFASQLMSWAAIANGGGVAAGGLVATLQSAGAAGIGFFSNLVIGSAAGTAGSALAHTLSEKPGSSEGAENQCKICLDSKMDTVFEPCGHLFTCSSCAKKLPMCPICGKHIQMLHIANNS